MTSMQWEDVTSESGEAYQVGHATGTDDPAEVDAPVSTPSLSGIKVNWPVTDNDWPIETKHKYPELYNLGISKYFVTYSKMPFYDYVIAIYNHRNRTFKFTDEEGKEPYLLSTDRYGWHTVRYNSKKPTIVMVE